MAEAPEPARDRGTRGDGRADAAEHGHAQGPAAGACRKAGCHSPAQGHTRQRGVVSAWRPQLIQGWMYDGNVGAWILSGLMRGRLPVVWNVRHSLHRLEEEKTRTRWVIKAGALISRHPKKIIYNSCVSAKQHERLGYHQRRTVVIPNGFHTGRFTPSDERRRQVRHRLGISEDAFVVGMGLVSMDTRLHESVGRAGTQAADLYNRRRSRICWPNEESSCPTKPFASGAGSSAPTTLGS